MLKNIKRLVAELLDVQIEQARMLSQLYRNTLRTLTYLIPEAYSKPFQTPKMMTHIENPGIVRAVHSGFSSIFWNIQQHSAI